MTKQLKLTKSNDSYQLNDEENNKHIVINNCTINGEELYNTFFADVDVAPKYKVDYDDEYKIIGKQIQSLFDVINTKINELN